MSCPVNRSRLVELELGLLPPGHAARLRAHIERCEACATSALDERRLSESLAVLRGEIPFEIDVTARVVRRIGEIAPKDHGDVPAWQLGWAAATAACLAVVVFASFVLVSGDLALVARDAWTAARGLTETLGRGLSALLSLVAVPFRILVWLLDQLSRLGPLVARLEPFVVASSAGAIAIMAATVILVVSRDLRIRAIDSARLSLL
jgi:anti-sigma factor RsiW